VITNHRILQMNTILHPHLLLQSYPSGCMCVDLYRVKSRLPVERTNTQFGISQRSHSQKGHFESEVFRWIAQ